MKLLSAFKFLSCLFIFMVMSCQEVNQDPIVPDSGEILDRTFKIGQESTFRYRQLYTSTDGQSTLKLNTINDSRCPAGVKCGWQGEITLYGEWTTNQTKSAFEVHSLVKSMDQQPNGFTIQIVDATPYPVFGANNSPADMVFTLLIQKNNPKIDTLTFAPSFKGWELYSWPTGNDWNYSILMGTNRSKTYQEVITNKIAVLGKDSLKILLNKMPAKEEIMWFGKRAGEGWENLSFPDNNTINEIKNYCIQKELILHVLQ